MTTPQIPFPRYTREENLRCKLTDKDIEDIQERREGGQKYKDIAEIYNITPQAVYYWCLSQEAREERGRNRKQVSHNDPERFKEYRKRKYQLHPEYRKYERQFDTEWKHQRPNNKLVTHKSYLTAKKKDKWYLKNKHSRFIKQWGKAVWNEHHRLYMHGIRKSFAEVKELLNRPGEPESVVQGR